MALNSHSITRRHFVLGVVACCAVCSACKQDSSTGNSVGNFVIEPFMLSNISDIPFGITPYDDLRVSIEKRAKKDKVLMRALQLVCTHQSCALRVPEQSGGPIVYTCPCHGAQFNAEGEVLRGPAKKPLRWLKLSASEEGNILLHADEKVSADVWLEIPRMGSGS